MSKKSSTFAAEKVLSMPQKSPDKVLTITQNSPDKVK